VQGGHWLGPCAKGFPSIVELPILDEIVFAVINEATEHTTTNMKKTLVLMFPPPASDGFRNLLVGEINLIAG
jgi:hypothetical protein